MGTRVNEILHVIWRAAVVDHHDLVAVSVGIRPKSVQAFSGEIGFVKIGNYHGDFRSIGIVPSLQWCKHGPTATLFYANGLANALPTRHFSAASASKFLFQPSDGSSNAPAKGIQKSLANDLDFSRKIHQSQR